MSLPVSSPPTQYFITSLPDHIAWADFIGYVKNPSTQYWVDPQFKPMISKSLEKWWNFFVNTKDEQTLANSVRGFAFTYHYYYKNIQRYSLLDLKTLSGGFGHFFDHFINFSGFIRRRQTTRIHFWLPPVSPHEDPLPDFTYFWKCVWFLGSAFSEQKIFADWDIEHSPWVDGVFVACFIQSVRELIDNIARYESIVFALGQELLSELDPNKLNYHHIQQLFLARPALFEEAKKCFLLQTSERESSAFRQASDEEFFARRHFNTTQLMRVYNGYPISSSESQFLFFRRVHEFYGEGL